MLEAIAAILTLLSVVLLKYKNKLGWWFGIVAAALYGVVFFQTGIIYQSALQIIFILQGVYGIYQWGETKEVLIKNMDSFKLFDIIIAFSVICILGFITGLTVTNLEEISIRWLDVYTVGLALVANWLLIKGIRQSWYVWIMVDVILIGLFIYLGLWWSAILYSILLANAINASIKWNYEYKNKEL